MTKKQIEERLIAMFWNQQTLETLVEEGEADESEVFFEGVREVMPFSEYLCTMDNGVVVDLADGTQICLTIQIR